MAFNLVFEREVLGRPWPNLAPDQPAYNGYAGMGDTYPYIVPCRLLYYCQDHGYPYTVNYVGADLPDHSYYPVGLGWFDYSQDYFAGMSSVAIDLVRSGRMRVLFYYHEGDSPILEQQHLDVLVAAHELPADCYRFVSGNTAAHTVDRFVYFCDHELFYWRNSVVWNQTPQTGNEYHGYPRAHAFTLLSRVHKWWRATVVADLHRRGLLHTSQWSYGIVDMGDQYTDNPIELHRLPGLESYMNKFVAEAPYTCDTLDSVEHNSHWLWVPEHYSHSYFNLVLETLYDAEQSGGAFLTEKTFKPIRHAQPLVIFGCAGSLSVLRSLGYRTFDHVLDNSYDTITHNTERYLRTVELVANLAQQDLHQVFEQCREDIQYNQQLFVSSKWPRLNMLEQQLTTS
jgi:hypothetical protein